MDLKQKLIEFVKNDYIFPNDMDANVFVDEVKEALKSTDGNLRDRLALNVICKLIEDGKLSDDKCCQLLQELISDKYLLCGLGEECDDSVFGRSFSTYPISAILAYNRQVERRILTDEDIKNVFTAAIKYVQEEKDLRGFVDDKGWADSIGHGADFLASLAEDPALSNKELNIMLDAIKDKICINHACHGATVFRLSAAVSEILKRELISEKEFSDWVASFLKYENSGDYMKDMRLAYNRSEFFVGLSGRLKEQSPDFYPYASNAFFELI